MKYQIICIHDSAADAYGAPQFVLSVGGAVRGFSDEVNRKADGNALNAHPGDFTLHKLGSFDDQTATFEVGPPEQIARGADLIQG